MYKYNLGFRDGKYIGSTDDCFQRIVSIGKPAPKKVLLIDLPPYITSSLELLMLMKEICMMIS